MSYTITRRWPKNAKGDRQARCDVCGVRWRRSQLVRDAAGSLRCPDDRRGRDAVTLSRLNAESVTVQRRQGQEGGGVNPDADLYVGPTAEEILGDG